MFAALNNFGRGKRLNDQHRILYRGKQLAVAEQKKRFRVQVIDFCASWTPAKTWRR
jgi:hypothetical protein